MGHPQTVLPWSTWMRRASFRLSQRPEPHGWYFAEPGARSGGIPGESLPAPFGQAPPG